VAEIVFPHDDLMERAVLGAILAGHSQSIELLDTLKQEDFFNTWHRKIVCSILDCTLQAAVQICSPFTMNSPGTGDQKRLEGLPMSQAFVTALPSKATFSMFFVVFGEWLHTDRQCTSPRTSKNSLYSNPGALNRY
jgi:replicative DNA helicase